MRRLAKYSRNDRVRSARDYQEIHERRGVALRLDSRRSCTVSFTSTVSNLGNVPLIGAGGYFKADVAGHIGITLSFGSHSGASLHQCGTEWSGFATATKAPAPGNVHLRIVTPRRMKILHIWGLDCGALNLPDAIIDAHAATVDLPTLPHLAPETLYLPHEVAMGMDPVEDEWEGARFVSGDGAQISVKKCAYCQRLLPLDITRPSALAFHKHNSKRTGHQNECRACKKWRINDTFNPRRTTDQLHESSLITRERKLFLREPEILQRFKDRSGAGLKSIVWKRFAKRCFRCGNSLRLSEVQLDHTRPLAYLWPIDEYATCLCSQCNSHKRERFPVDVYSEAQLHELARITGLPHASLVRKEVNDIELKRILRDIAPFAREWDARTFNATARKIRELRPQIDLFEVLGRADAALLSEVQARLRQRPGDDDD